MSVHQLANMFTRHGHALSDESESESDSDNAPVESMDLVETSRFDLQMNNVKVPNTTNFDSLAVYFEAVSKMDATSTPGTPAKQTSTLANDIDAIRLRLQDIMVTPKPLLKSPLAESPFLQSMIAKNTERDAEIERLRLLEIAKAAKPDPFPKLSAQAEEIINKAFSRGPNPVVSGFNVDLTRDDIKTLSPGTWLNDEVINFYGSMLMDRAQRHPDQYPKIHFFNTFFYTTLCQQGYDRVRRWTKKFDLFALDYVIIPVHLGMHWTCSTINFKKKRIEFYDSLHGSNRVKDVYRKYLDAESLDKRKKPFDFTGWTDYCPPDIPGQLNGYDCGVFTCMYAEYIAREAEFDFSQNVMGYIRRRMVYEICTKKLQFD